MSDHSIPQGTEKQFLLGGVAIFTLQSEKTGRRYTYKVVSQKYRPTHCIVKLLKGPSIEKDFMPIGILSKNSLFFDIFNNISEEYYYVKAFRYFIEHIDNLSPQLGVYHAGKCCFCGRDLTTPDSIERGYGRKCGIAKGLVERPLLAVDMIKRTALGSCSDVDEACLG